MNATDNVLAGMGSSALFAMHDAAKRRAAYAIDLGMDEHTILIRQSIVSEYEAEINRRGYEVPA